MPGFISPRCSALNVRFEGEATILGPTTIGPGTIVGNYTTIGYPMRSSVYRLLESYPATKPLINGYDSVSEGARIGASCFIRSGSVVYESVLFGDGVETGHHVLVRERSTIGEKARIGTSTIIDGNVKIGARANVQSNCYVPPGSIIGEDAFLGPRTTLLNDRFPPSRKLTGARVMKGAAIGAAAILLPGITVGEGSVVAAGAIVTKDVEPDTVVRSPVAARYHATRSEYESRKRVYEETV